MPYIDKINYKGTEYDLQDTALKEDLLALEQEGYPYASIKTAVNAWADDNEAEIVNAYVTPQMYGAKGDGVANDTEAIQTALEKKGFVFFPKGVYNITSPLNISKDTILIGCGSESVLNAKFSSVTTSNYRDYPTLLAENVENVVISDIQLVTEGVGVSFNGCNHVSICNIELESDYFGIVIKDSYGFTISDIKINNSHLYSDGIHIDSGHDGIIKNVFGSGADDFIALNALEGNAPIYNLHFSNIYATNAPYSVRIYGSGTTTKISNITFENCNFSSQLGITGNGVIRFTNAVSTMGDSGANDLNIDNIIFKNCIINTKGTNTVNIFMSYTTGKAVFENCLFLASVDGTTMNTIQMNEGGGLSLINCSFDVHGKSTRLLYVEGSMEDLTIIGYEDAYPSTINGVIDIAGTAGDIYFENIKETSCGNFARFRNTFGNLIAKNCKVTNSLFASMEGIGQSIYLENCDATTLLQPMTVQTGTMREYGCKGTNATYTGGAYSADNNFIKARDRYTSISSAMNYTPKGRKTMITFLSSGTLIATVNNGEFISGEIIEGTSDIKFDVYGNRNYPIVYFTTVTD